MPVNPQILWSRVLGDTQEDGIFSIASMHGGGFIATGYTEELDEPGYDLWALRLDAEGWP